ncbi:hypothetical protein CHS0354_023214 [Potamilus streckersoni]|uniref:Uncharacterized protein n=1 Tax=Potamilus streckersoni TaxID=2493646 RepID=A0AAE0SJC4_9BIVA|nr:hypothetical protein CHS0354_023214 [Potamilus streckersoni]
MAILNQHGTAFWICLKSIISVPFVCLHCGPDPDTVIMDATSVSFRKELVSWQNILSLGNTIAKPYDTRDADRQQQYESMFPFIDVYSSTRHLGRDILAFTPSIKNILS